MLLQRLSYLRQVDIPTLVFKDPVYSSSYELLFADEGLFGQEYRIPLFIDEENGVDYYITLANQYTYLPSRWCSLVRPCVANYNDRTIHRLFQLGQRVLLSNLPEDSSSIPKTLLFLGDLGVRTTKPKKDYPGGMVVTLESTHYEVAIDIDNKDTPLWLLARRKDLQFRTKWLRRFPLPYIFRGLLMNHEMGNTPDIACISYQFMNLVYQVIYKNQTQRDLILFVS